MGLGLGKIQVDIHFFHFMKLAQNTHTSPTCSQCLPAFHVAIMVLTRCSRRTGCHWKRITGVRHCLLRHNRTETTCQITQNFGWISLKWSLWCLSLVTDQVHSILGNWREHSEEQEKGKVSKRFLRASSKLPCKTWSEKKDDRLNNRAGLHL